MAGNIEPRDELSSPDLSRPRAAKIRTGRWRDGERSPSHKWLGYKKTGQSFAARKTCRTPSAVGEGFFLR